MKEPLYHEQLFLTGIILYLVFALRFPQDQAALRVVQFEFVSSCVMVRVYQVPVLCTSYQVPGTHFGKANEARSSRAHPASWYLDCSKNWYSTRYFVACTIRDS